MSPLFGEDILAEVARANDIVEVISGYFPMKRAGKDFKALCPFHSEKTASFTVSPAKQIYKCFGCGRGGGVFNFIMAKENVSFPEAVRMLAERAGVRLLESSSPGPGPDPLLNKRQIYRALEWAAKCYEKWLAEAEGETAREYLASRGLGSAEVLEKFRLGFAPAGWDNLLRKARESNVSAELLAAAGLAVKRSDGSGYYDRFRGRLMFPIFDMLGRTTGFGGRILDGPTGSTPGSEAAASPEARDEPKYLNSPETAVFKKGEGLYALPQARAAIEQQREAVVVEGYTDALKAHSMGVENTVATLGTALTVEHTRILGRFADEVVVVFDSDLAGRRAADRSLELFLAQDVNISVVALPEGKDPFDFLESEGKEGFLAIISGAREALEYKWQLVQEEFGARRSIAGQRRALEAVLVTLAKVPSLARPETSLRRELLMKKISNALGISEEVLRAELARLSRGAAIGFHEEEGRNLVSGPSEVGKARWAIERELLTVLVKEPSRLGGQLDGRAPKLGVDPSGPAPQDFVEPAHKELFSVLVRAAAEVQDGEIGGVVALIENEEVSSLAVELFSAAEEKGSLDTIWDGAIAALKRLRESDTYRQHRDAVKKVNNDDEEEKRALRAIQEVRQDVHGFLPPNIARK